MDASSCGIAKRRKIPIQKRETKEQRAVTFSKRRVGLFNKAAELCVLCNARVVILVSAPLAKREKFYTFAHPNINLLLDAFLNNGVPYPIHSYNNPSTPLLCQNMEQLTPKDNKESKIKKRKRECEGFWWEDDFDAYQTPEELELLIGKLEKLREDVALRLQKASSFTDQDISTYDHQNHHAGCDVEDILNVNHEYNDECDDQGQFIPSVMLQELSTSTYHGGCLGQNIVSIDGYKSNADLMQMVPLKSIIVTPNINNDGQDIGNYHYDMRTTFEAPFFSSNGVDTIAESNFGWMDDKVTAPYIQNEQPSSFLPNGLHHHIGTSFGWELRSNNHSFLQDSNIGLAPPFSFGDKDAGTYNCPESNFKDNSLASFAEISEATINNDLLSDSNHINSSATEDDVEFFSFLESFFSN